VTPCATGCKLRAFDPAHGGGVETLYVSPPTDGDTVAATETFLEGVQQLTPAQWKSVMKRSRALGDGLLRDDLVRGAVVAITVRHVLPGVHFEVLYGPFADAIPVGSLFPADRLG
jgi:hypothetical protein